MIDLTIIMATIPERLELRQQAIDSIEAQTVKPAAVLYEIDENHRGPVATFNSLAERVTTEWLFPFADDDLLDPNHFEVLARGNGVESMWLDVPEISDIEPDVVYTWCRVTGRADTPETRFQVYPKDQHEFEALREGNFIPGSAAIRTSLWSELGGYQDPGIMGHEDWHFWVRALNAGARFLCIPEVTWTYRVNPEWEHVNNGQLA